MSGEESDDSDSDEDPPKTSVPTKVSSTAHNQVEDEKEMESKYGFDNYDDENGL